MATNYLDTGDTGRAVSAESDGALFAGIFGAEKYVLENGSQLKAEVQSNNIVKISDGDAVMYGRHVRIPENDSALVTINNGHSGTNRIDLIVFRYTKDSTGKETVDLVVIQGEDSTGTATAPTAVDGNILTGAMQSDFPLYSVELNGINIVKVNPLFNVIGNISKLKEELTELNSKTKWKLFGTATGIKGINIKELADSGKDIRAVVTAQYDTKGGKIKFVFDLSPGNVIGTYSDGYCFSPNNYATVAIIVGKSYDFFVQKSWWSMRENASTTIPINDETVKLEVYYR